MGTFTGTQNLGGKTFRFQVFRIHFIFTKFLDIIIMDSKVLTARGHFQLREKVKITRGQVCSIWWMLKNLYLKNRFIMSASQTSTRAESNDEMLAVSQLREWVEIGADFKSRKDDDFLLMFLHSCDLKQELARKTLTKYYQNKINIPQWWSNKDHTDYCTKVVFDHKIYTNFLLLYKDQPVTSFTPLANLHIPELSVDEYGIASTSIAEYIIRLKNIQLNGFVGVFDGKDYQFRPSHAVIILKIAKNVVDTFYIGLPIKLNAIHVFNVSFMISWIAKTFVLPCLPASVKDRIHFHPEELSSMRNYLPPEWLPEELGGTAGPLSKHHNDFLERFQIFNDHLLDNDNYGYGK